MRMIVETDAKHRSYGINARAPRIRNETSTVKRRTLKKYSKILATITFLAGCGIAANAQTHDVVIAKMPFQFVAGDKTLPAGTYKVSRFSDDPTGPLLLAGDDNSISVFLIPMASEGVSAEKPGLTFEQVGEEHFLKTIQTPLETYYIAVSHSGISEAAAKLHNNGAASGASGNE